MGESYVGFSSVERQNRWPIEGSDQPLVGAPVEAKTGYSQNDQMSQSQAPKTTVDYTQKSDHPKLEEPHLSQPPEQVIAAKVQQNKLERENPTPLQQLLQKTVAQSDLQKNNYAMQVSGSGGGLEALQWRLGSQKVEQIAKEYGVTPAQLTGSLLFDQLFPQMANGQLAPAQVKMVLGEYRPALGEQMMAADKLTQLLGMPLNMLPNGLQGKLQQTAQQLNITPEQLMKMLQNKQADSSSKVPQAAEKLLNQMTQMVQGKVRSVLIDQGFTEGMQQKLEGLSEKVGLPKEVVQEQVVKTKEALVAGQMPANVPENVVLAVKQQLFETVGKLNPPLLLPEPQQLETFLANAKGSMATLIERTADRSHLNREQVEGQLIALNKDPSTQVAEPVRQLMEQLRPQLNRLSRDQLEDSEADAAFVPVLQKNGDKIAQEARKLGLEPEQLVEQITQLRSGKLEEQQVPKGVAELTTQLEAQAQLIGKERASYAVSGSLVVKGIEEENKGMFSVYSKQIAGPDMQQKLLFARHYPEFATAGVKSLSSRVEQAVDKHQGELGVAEDYKPFLSQGQMSPMSERYDGLYEKGLEQLTLDGKVSPDEAVSMRAAHYYPEQVKSLPKELQSRHEALEKQTVGQLRKEYGALPGWSPVPATGNFEMMMSGEAAQKVEVKQLKEGPKSGSELAAAENQAAEEVKQAHKAPKEVKLAAAPPELSAVAPQVRKMAAGGDNLIQETLSAQQKVVSSMPPDDVNSVAYSKFLLITRGAIDANRELLYLIGASNARLAQVLSLMQHEKRLGQLRELEEKLAERREAIEEMQQKEETMNNVLIALFWVMPVFFLIASLSLTIANGDPSYMWTTADIAMGTPQNSSLAQRAEIMKVVMYIFMIAMAIIMVILAVLSVAAIVLTGGAAAAAILPAWAAAIPAIVALFNLAIVAVAVLSVIALALTITQVVLMETGQEDAAAIVGYVLIAIDILTLLIGFMMAAAAVMKEMMQALVTLMQNVMKNLLKVLTELAEASFKEAARMLQELLKELIDDIAKVVRGIVEDVADLLRQVMDKLKKTINSLDELLKGGLKGLRGGGSSGDDAAKAAKTAEEASEIRGVARGAEHATTRLYLSKIKEVLETVEQGGSIFQDMLDAYQAFTRARMAQIRAVLDKNEIEMRTINQYYDSVVQQIRIHVDDLFREIRQVTQQIKVIGQDSGRFWSQMSKMTTGIANAL